MKAKLGQGEKECDKKNSQATMHSGYECYIMFNKRLGGSLQTQDDLFFWYSYLLPQSTNFA